MAFSATIRGTVALGGPCGLRIIHGEWTGTSGDAAGTLAVSGGAPVAAIFQKMDPLDKSFEILPRVGVATSSGITTYTIENQDDVTTGKFFLIHGGW
jgi:hypothetical protein